MRWRDFFRQPGSGTQADRRGPISAKEANAELGLAFIAEFERAVGILRAYPRLDPVWRETTRRFPPRA